MAVLWIVTALALLLKVTFTNSFFDVECAGYLRSKWLSVVVILVMVSRGLLGTKILPVIFTCGLRMVRTFIELFKYSARQPVSLKIAWFTNLSAATNRSDFFRCFAWKGQVEWATRLVATWMQMWALSSLYRLSSIVMVMKIHFSFMVFIQS